jgi:hypothetical protein
MISWLRDRLRAMRFDPPELSGALGFLLGLGSALLLLPGQRRL